MYVGLLKQVGFIEVEDSDLPTPPAHAEDGLLRVPLQTLCRSRVLDLCIFHQLPLKEPQKQYYFSLLTAKILLLAVGALQAAGCSYPRRGLGSWMAHLVRVDMNCAIGVPGLVLGRNRKQGL